MNEKGQQNSMNYIAIIRWHLLSIDQNDVSNNKKKKNDNIVNHIVKDRKKDQNENKSNKRYRNISYQFFGSEDGRG